MIVESCYIKAISDRYLKHLDLFRPHEKCQENNIQSLLTKVYKCLNNEVPSFLRGTFCNQIKNYNLLSLPKASTNVALHYFVYRGSSCWNNLPDSYKECDSSS